MKDTLIVSVNLSSMPTDVLWKWAECYCQIWKEEPWNEYFWKPESVISDFRAEMSRPQSSGFIAMQGKDVVGFTHGYSVCAEELSVIAGSELLNELFETDKRIFYIDELGVAMNHRGHGVSKLLTQALLNSVRKNELNTVVLRTDVKAEVARHVYEKLGFKEYAVHDTNYPDRTYWVLQISCVLK